MTKPVLQLLFLPTLIEKRNQLYKDLSKKFDSEDQNDYKNKAAEIPQKIVASFDDDSLTEEEITDYIKKDSLSAARKVFEQIKEKAQSSNFFPLRGKVVPELQKEGITIYRELIAQPYRIMYKSENETVYIMAIFDSRQNVSVTIF